MILEWILTPLFFLAKLFLGLFPAFSVPEGLTSSVSVVFSLLSAVGYFFPLGTFALVVGVFLAFEFLVFSVSGFNWLFRKIPSLS